MYIFIKIHENLKNEGKSRKKHKTGEGGEAVGNKIYLALLGHFLLHTELFIGTP